MHSVQFLQLEASPHFRAFLPWALLLLSPFSVRPFAASGKGVGRLRRDSVSSGELTTLRLNGRRHSSSSGSAAFHPNTRAAAAAAAAGCWCRQAGGQRRRRRRRQAEESGGEGTAQKTPLTLLLPSTRFVPPVLAVSGLGVSSSPRFLSLERPCSSDGWATRGARTHLSQCSNGCRQSAAPRIGESYFDRMGVIVKWQIFR